MKNEIFEAILAAAENDYQQFLASEKTENDYQQFCAVIKNRKGEIKEKADFFEKEDEFFRLNGDKKRALLKYFDKLARVFCNGENAYFQAKVEKLNKA